jgi:hypothetical protein
MLIAAEGPDARRRVPPEQHQLQGRDHGCPGRSYRSGADAAPYIRCLAQPCCCLHMRVTITVAVAGLRHVASGTSHIQRSGGPDAHANRSQVACRMCAVLQPGLTPGEGQGCWAPLFPLVALHSSIPACRVDSTRCRITDHRCWTKKTHDKI